MSHIPYYNQTEFDTPETCTNIAHLAVEQVAATSDYVDKIFQLHAGYYKSVLDQMWAVSNDAL